MNHARRRVTDEQEAFALLDAWKDRQMDFRAFCAAHKIDGRSLRPWCPKPTDGFVRLVELTTATATATVPSARSAYRLTVGEVRIELDDDFREETLTRLLSVLRC